MVEGKENEENLFVAWNVLSKKTGETQSFLIYEGYLYLAQIINGVYGFSFPLHHWTEYLLSTVNL